MLLGQLNSLFVGVTAKTLKDFHRPGTEYTEPLRRISLRNQKDLQHLTDSRVNRRSTEALTPDVW